MKTTEQINQLRKEIQERISDSADTEQLKLEYLGRKGKVSALMRSIGEAQPAERAAVGAEIQAFKQEIEELLGGTSQNIVVNPFDPTLPAQAPVVGSLHPVTAMIEEMVKIFTDLAFEVVEGNEIVSDQENFEWLNIHKDHPARDGQDSFYLSDNIVLRTQTTAVQVLEMRARMKQGKFPMRLIVPGKTYRREADQTHSAMFHQIDAVVVDTQTTFSDLRGILDYFAKRLFGDSADTRFRPHHFPFTEPSAEMDIRLKGPSNIEGKHTQWLEFGGCGMIHPSVLERAGINPKIYQGWAFGMSIERPIMVRSHIPDIRLLYGNSINFLEQISSL